MLNQSTNVELASNGFGLCVSLPLHKCSNYSRKLIGQIAQNPCYTLGGLGMKILINNK